MLYYTGGMQPGSSSAGCHDIPETVLRPGTVRLTILFVSQRSIGVSNSSQQHLEMLLVEKARKPVRYTYMQ